ncbi:signal recognition particle 9 kDa protein-domain-containing protein [Cercophora scortea]|uniref:Signal recognition particle 9 kDa protein-domain-containing protein n=1 Tax=Cercophora scortea TaxID=314031 RepID=A0AAE0MIK6_9PEZI|nr:signal recognition particle 9 kDa protein-domain-containing protein [Cercophora scortea]
MPYYDKSEDWLHQSALLLQARPATTRITTRYNLKPAHRVTKAEKAAAAAASTTSPPPSTANAASKKPPRGHLVLKTFDPSSGVCLKYKTSKAAEVGRLVQMLGTLGRRMAALPEVAVSGGGAQDEVMADAAAEAEVGVGSGVQTPVPSAAAAAAAAVPAAASQAGGGGKGKKKKGKR